MKNALFSLLSFTTDNCHRSLFSSHRTYKHVQTYFTTRPHPTPFHFNRKSCKAPLIRSGLLSKLPKRGRPFPFPHQKRCRRSDVIRLAGVEINAAITYKSNLMIICLAHDTCECVRVCVVDFPPSDAVNPSGNRSAPRSGARIPFDNL